MKGSEFLARYKNLGASAWEAAAVDMCARGLFCAWPLLPLTFKAGGHVCELEVASDYLSVGTPDDPLRLPMTPRLAQTAADLFDMLLPTRKIATEVWRQAAVKLTPTPMAPNLGPNLQQYADHSAAIDAELARVSGRGIVTGHKKDVVTGKLVRPNNVVIWGWFWPDDPVIHGPYMTRNLRASQPIQPYDGDAHGAGYVDYSHGIRFVSGVCKVDGRSKRTIDVLSDPELAALLSDEGPLDSAHARYPSAAVVRSAVPYGIVPEGGRTNPADRGLDVIRERMLEKENGPT